MSAASSGTRKVPPFKLFMTIIPLLNALTVDVEDYFQVSAFEHRVDRSDWDAMPCRVEASTDKLLAMFASAGVKATFFVLGWIAERYPELVKRIAADGHELASHGYWHRLIYEITPEQFRDDLTRSRNAIEQAAGVRVTAYRAPSFSIGPRSLWALEILVESGFTIDSSIFPVRHDRYGMPQARLEPHEIATSAGTITEFPPSVWQVGRFNLPIAGGGYFRLYPLGLTRRGITAVTAGQRPFMFYLHPWEVDPEQPRIRDVGWKRQWRHAVGLRHTESKLRRLLKTVPFDTLSRALGQYQRLHTLASVDFSSDASRLDARGMHQEIVTSA
jgi:polysaccharide deacetylase family protein (PEP-CTERM system associated)